MLEGENHHNTLVYYSIGNFINFTSDSFEGTADRAIGAMADITIKKDINSNVNIKDYKAVPLVTHMVEETGKITTYKLSDYGEILAQQNEMTKKDSRFSYSFCNELSEKIFGTVAN